MSPLLSLPDQAVLISTARPLTTTQIACRERTQKDENVISLVLHTFRNLFAIQDRVSTSSSATAIEESSLQVSLPPLLKVSLELLAHGLVLLIVRTDRSFRIGKHSPTIARDGRSSRLDRLCSVEHGRLGHLASSVSRSQARRAHGSRSKSKSSFPQSGP